MLAAWAAFPLLLFALALGCGLFLERATGARLPGTLVAPVGLATLIVEAHLLTLSDATAELATPAVVATAVAGLALARGRPLRPDPAALCAAVAVFGVFALPVAASGEATFAGYIKLDDTATWLAITDRVMEHGRSVEGLAPSTHEAAFSLNVSGGYPIGAFLPLGAGAVLLPTDPAWLFQPYLCVLAAMLALALCELVRPLVRRPALRAGAAFVAAQPALLFGYSLWGGVKEVVAAALVALVVALLAWALVDLRPRRAIAPAAASAALVAVLSFGGAVWLALPLIAGVVTVARSHARAEPLRPAGTPASRRDERARALRAAAAFAAAAGVFALPSLLTAEVFLRPAAGVVTDSAELGNLIEPLSPLQLAGAWPAGDFRVDPDSLAIAYVLVGAVAAAAAWGLAAAVRTRAWGLVAYASATTIACLAVAAFGSPWIDGKAFATAAPALLLPAAAFAAWALERHRLGGAVAAVAVAGGVLWSNALAYHDVSLAPRDRLAELERIGERIAGEGPALMTEYEPYGVRHFLRDADPEGASELRRRTVPLRAGGYLSKGQFADLDSFALGGLLVYRTLVLRRSPTVSRPPSAYARTWSGRHYEVWQRPVDTGTRILEHLPLGSAASAAGPAPCRQVRRLARLAGPDGSLAATTVPAALSSSLSEDAPPGWATDPADPTAVHPSEDGEATGTVTTTAGTFDVWLGGSVRRTARVDLAGRRAGSVRHALNPAGQYVPVGRVELPAGRHRFGVEVADSALRAGGGGPPPPLGPLALSEADHPRALLEVPTARARTLCGRRLDWVEALAPR